MSDSSKRGTRRGPFALLLFALAGLTLLGVVPAGAEGEGGVGTQEEPGNTTAPPETTTPPETTAPPDTTTPPETTAPPDTSSPPTDGPQLARQSSVAAIEESEEPGDVVIFAFGDPCQGVGSNSWESDARADPNGQCSFGNIGQGPPAAVLAECTNAFGDDVTNFFNSGTGNSGGDANVTGTISPHVPAGTHLNVTAQPGVIVDGVFVKAGNGFNTYIGVETDMIGPLVGVNKNFADISHFVICYHLGEPGGLDVDKVLAGGGTPDPQATFTITVDCADDAFDRVLTFDNTGQLTAGGPLPITGIPAGTQCTVTETGQGGADEVSYNPNGGTPADPPTVTIGSGQTVTVTVTNTFHEPETGGLNVIKSVVGPVPQGTTFTITVNCDDDNFDRVLTFDETGQLTGGGPLPITGIPLGTQCSVTETGQGGADDVAYSPDGGTPADPPTVTISVAGQTIVVTVTNTYDEPEVGGLNVTKSLVGPVPQGTTFTITVNCDDDAFDRVLMFDETGMLTAGGPLPLLGIPLGTQCSVTETSDGGADNVTYSPNGGTPVDPPTVTISVEGQTVTVTVTNSFDEPGPSEPPFGAISVEKAVAGTPPPGAVYTVRVTCDGTTAILNFGANGGTQTLTGIPIEPGGTSCTVEETGQGGASQVSYSPQGTTFTLTVQSPARVLTVTNVFDPQPIRIGRSGTLPFTGSPTAPLVRLAISFLAIGSIAVLVTRRRRNRAAA